MSRIVRRDLGSGAEKELHQGPPRNDLWIALSPDERWLAFLNMPLGCDADTILRVMPATGGELREIWQFRDPGYVFPAWSADAVLAPAFRKLGLVKENSVEVASMAARTETLAVVNQQFASVASIHQ